MYRNECYYQYRRLLELLEKDSEEIKASLKGDAQEAYDKLLLREKDSVNNALKSIKNILY